MVSSLEIFNRFLAIYLLYFHTKYELQDNKFKLSSVWLYLVSLIRQICKIMPVAMSLSVSVCVCICVSVTMIRTGHILAKVKSVKKCHL